MSNYSRNGVRELFSQFSRYGEENFLRLMEIFFPNHAQEARTFPVIALAEQDGECDFNELFHAANQLIQAIDGLHMEENPFSEVIPLVQTLLMKAQSRRNMPEHTELLYSTAVAVKKAVKTLPAPKTRWRRVREAADEILQHVRDYRAHGYREFRIEHFTLCIRADRGVLKKVSDVIQEAITELRALNEDVLPADSEAAICGLPFLHCAPRQLVPINLCFEEGQSAHVLLAKLHQQLRELIAGLEHVSGFAEAVDFLQTIDEGLSPILRDVRESGQLEMLGDFLCELLEDVLAADAITSLQLILPENRIEQLQATLKEIDEFVLPSDELEPYLYTASVPIIGESQRVKELHRQLEFLVHSELSEIVSQEASAAGYEFVEFNGGWVVTQPGTSAEAQAAFVQNPTEQHAETQH